MKFKEISLEDKEWINELLTKDNRNACEYTFSNNFLWRKIYGVMVAKIHGCGVIRFKTRTDCKAYSYPFGDGDKRLVIQELMDYSEKEGSCLCLTPVLEKDREQLMEWFPGQFCIKEERNNWDYVYSVEKLTKLSGKKLASKRNHIARFKDNDNWGYESITSDNIEECRQMSNKWVEANYEKWNEDMQAEISVVHEALDNFEKLGLTGGLLKRDGNVIAFTIGERLNNNTFVVHFEKAFSDIQGAYPMINQQFVMHECCDYEFVNREEDTGAEGLRRAKMSYQPDFLVNKMVAIKSNIVFADPIKNRDDIVKIWSICFGDSDSFIDDYIANRMTKQNMFLAYEDGKFVAMGSFLDAEYVCKDSDGTEKTLPVKYVYALATLPEYQGKGIASRIMDYADKIYGVPLVLCPADDKLGEFYEKKGFVWNFDKAQYKNSYEDILKLENKKVQAADIDENIIFSEISAKQYVNIRNELYNCNTFSDEIFSGYIKWDEKSVEYAIHMNHLLGGETLLINEKWCVMYNVNGPQLEIIELIAPEEYREQIIEALFEKTKTSDVVYNNLGGMIRIENKNDYKILCNSYLNLTLG